MSDSKLNWHGHAPGLRVLRIIGFVLLGVVGAAVFALAFGWFVMLLWNWLMPSIFHLAEIGFWQAFGIIILAKLIFGAIGPGRHGPGGGHGPWRRHGPWDAKDEKNRWRYYRDFWEKEGKEAFDRYVEKRKSEEEGPKEQKA
jgi:hypothetical protein